MNLLDYRSQTRTELSDLNVTTWDDDILDQALRQGLADYNDAHPDEAIATLTFASAVRELNVSSLARLIEITRLWLPYTAADPEHPPQWRTGFELWPGSILYIGDDPKPAANDVARIWYTRRTIIDGLDAATSTTVAAEHEPLLVTGAAAYAASARSREISEAINAENEAYRQTASFAFRKLNEFRAGLNRIRQKPAGGLVTLRPARRMRVPRQ